MSRFEPGLATRLWLRPNAKEGGEGGGLKLEQLKSTQTVIMTIRTKSLVLNYQKKLWLVCLAIVCFCFVFFF